jgi:hypothetical protein
VHQLDSTIQATLCRRPFPKDIQLHLVTFENPNGDINNNELELTASVAQHDILAQHFDIREATIHNSSDNGTMVWRQRKGTTPPIGPTDHLLNLQALHQLHYNHLHLLDYVAGEANAMENVCSRLWHMSDSQLIAYSPPYILRVDPGCYANCASQFVAL